jgi:hypothetical protein
MLTAFRKVLTHTDTADYLAKGIRLEVRVWGQDIDKVAKSPC